MSNFLAIDIGNTSTKVGWYKDGALFRLPALEELKAVVANNNFERAIVAESGKNDFVMTLLTANSIPVLQVNTQLKLPFSVMYRSADTLGADRIAALAGVVAMNIDTPVLCITAGTCLTYNLLSAENQFWGGAISPGFSMRLKAMHTFTQKLPMLSFEQRRPDLVGNDTVGSMQSGAINGALMEIEQAILLYQSQYKGLQVVITGGDAEFIAANVKKDLFLQPNLIIEGLYTILRHNE